jgi:phosphoribosylformylglycinamidine cyclo-ligase
MSATARRSFAWIHQAGGLAEEEMVRTFNCGVGMVAITDPADAEALLQRFDAAGERAFRLGRVTRQSGPHRVSYSGRLGFGA